MSHRFGSCTKEGTGLCPACLAAIFPREPPPLNRSEQAWAEGVASKAEASMALSLLRRRPRTILVDMDSILADFYWQVLNDYHAHTGVKLPNDFICRWDSKFPNGQTIHDYYSRPGFFRGLKPIPGAIPVLKKYYDIGHDIFIASSATLTGAPAEKFEWLAEHMPWLSRDRVSFLKEKWRLRGDILIDDHHENVRKFKLHNPRGRTVGIIYPYNVNHYNGCFDFLADGYLDFESAWMEIDSVLDFWTRG